LIGFDQWGQVQPALHGWPVFRYGEHELAVKKLADGELNETPLTEWAVRHRFMQPGTHQPFVGYQYAEQAVANEVVS
jgi:hypothetical protein